MLFWNHSMKRLFDETNLRRNNPNPTISTTTVATTGEGVKTMPRFPRKSPQRVFRRGNSAENFNPFPLAGPKKAPYTLGNNWIALQLGSPVSTKPQTKYRNNTGACRFLVFGQPPRHVPGIKNLIGHVGGRREVWFAWQRYANSELMFRSEVNTLGRW